MNKDFESNLPYRLAISSPKAIFTYDFATEEEAVRKQRSEVKADYLKFGTRITKDGRDSMGNLVINMTWKGGVKVKYRVYDKRKWTC